MIFDPVVNKHLWMFTCCNQIYTYEVVLFVSVTNCMIEVAKPTEDVGGFSNHMLHMTDASLQFSCYKVPALSSALSRSLLLWLVFTAALTTYITHKCRCPRPDFCCI